MKFNISQALKSFPKFHKESQKKKNVLNPNNFYDISEESTSQITSLSDKNSLKKKRKTSKIDIKMLLPSPDKKLAKKFLSYRFKGNNDQSDISESE